VSQAVEQKDIKYKFTIEIANKESLRGIAWHRYLQPWKLKIVFYASNLTKPVKKYFEFTPNDSEDEPGELKETTAWD